MSELHAVQETRGSKCVSIWEKQSGGLFRSEYSIAADPSACIAVRTADCRPYEDAIVTG